MENNPEPHPFGICDSIAYVACDFREESVIRKLDKIKAPKKK